MWVASQGKQHCRSSRNSPGKSGASCVPVWEFLDRNHSDDLCNLCIISLFLVCVGPAVQMYSVFAFQTRLIVRRLRERRTHTRCWRGTKCIMFAAYVVRFVSSEVVVRGCLGGVVLAGFVVKESAIGCLSALVLYCHGFETQARNCRGALLTAV